MEGKPASLLGSVSFFLIFSLGATTIGNSVHHGRQHDQQQQQRRPHIIFILADDLGYNDVGYHGSEIMTPKIDYLARNGIRLENYYVQPICTPTRSQLMSGRYQIHTGLQHQYIWNEQPNCLPLDSPTIADKLKEAGYSTHMVGKWHLGFYKKECMPQYRGFNTYYGYLGGWENYWNHKIPYKGHPYLDLRNEKGPVRNESRHYSAHLFTKVAVDQIRDHGDSDKPFFLYMAYQSVHAPLEVPKKYKKPYHFIKDEKRKTYAGMVAALDEGVGNLTKILKEKGWWDNTLIVFSTDNGGQIHEGGNDFPLRGWKGSLFEGGIHGVGFVSGGFLKKNKGTVNRELLHVTDWFPTLVRLARGNVNGTKPLDGYDVWDTISSNKPTPRKMLLHNIDPLFEHRGKSQYPGLWDTRVRAAVRVGDYKLITGDPKNGSWVPPPGQGKATLDPSPPDQNVWLFNITDDPSELYDLSEKKPDVVRNLLKVIADYNNTAVAVRFPPQDPRANPKLHGGVWGPWE